MRVALAIPGPEHEQRDHDHAAADPEQAGEKAARAADRDEAPVEAATSRPARRRAASALEPRGAIGHRDTILSALLDPFDENLDPI